jgi:hypothetical protein
MFYLIYLIFLFAGHSGLSVAIGAAPWGVAQLGATVGWRDAGRGYQPDGRRDSGADTQGRGS